MEYPGTVGLGAEILEIFDYSDPGGSEYGFNFVSHVTSPTTSWTG
jgi:hypothetical protein